MQGAKHEAMGDKTSVGSENSSCGVSESAIEYDEKLLNLFTLKKLILRNDEKGDFEKSLLFICILRKYLLYLQKIYFAFYRAFYGREKNSYERVGLLV